MNSQSMIVAIGLVALMIAYAAVRDSQDGWSGTVGPLKWSFSGSWSSSIAVVLALVLVLLRSGAQATLVAFGILAVLAPLIYKGIGRSEGASKPVFFIVSAIMTWSTLVILYTAATSVPSLVSTLPILSVLVIDAALVLAILGAVMNSVRNLAAAASGDGSEAWILP